MIKIQDEKNAAYISFEDEYLAKDIIQKLKNFVKDNIVSKTIAVNMAGVESAQNDFFLLLKEFGKQENFALYNVGVDIILLINLMNYKQNLKIYSSKQDCINKKNQLISRKFKLC